MDTNRLEAFSDGVFAIAITLLVLEIKVPLSGSALGRELLILWPSYLAYVISFIVIGAIWINHHAMFDHIRRADHTLLLLNTIHLMFIAFIPFPTAVLAQALHDGTNEPIATSFYGGTLTVIGILVTFMWYYAAYEHRLLGENISHDEAKRNTRRFLVGPVCYGIGTLVALIVPWLALALYIALNVFFLWRRHEHTTSTNAT
ncbi:MAG: TMEM175 family protein [Thermodesulfobacteriota bacterium]